MNGIKLNIGCGPNGSFPGFDNLDNSPSVILSKWPFLKRILFRLGVINEGQLRADWSGVIRCDASKRLPYANESVEKIYTSHFLEHVPYDRALRVLSECHRVLKKDGLMRLVVPDLLWHAEKYVEATRAALNTQNRAAHDEFMETVSGAYLKRGRYGSSHFYMYDYPTLAQILAQTGFQRVRLVGYQEGADPELAARDNRPGESIHLEAMK